MAVLWCVVQVSVLGWLANFFGRTLRKGRIPLIEQIACMSDPHMTCELRCYTRRLTGIWCGYFIFAALLPLTADALLAWTGVLIWAGSTVLFIGEHWLRPHLFPGHVFPGLTQQLRDTWRVWHSGKRIPD